METPVTVENRAGLAADEFTRIAGAVSRHRSIKHAVDWLSACDPPLAPVDMVTQDESSHDVLAAHPGGLWLVYDST